MKIRSAEAREETQNPALPARPFGPLLVEGGDEIRLCEIVVGPEKWACVDSLVDCVKKNHAKPQDGDKAWLSAYLAMLPDPRMRLHSENVFNPDAGGIDPAHSDFDPLRRFLQSL